VFLTDIFISITFFVQLLFVGLCILFCSNILGHLEQNKMQKNAEKFTCNNCDFSCSNKFNYSKHILTAKHKNRTLRTNKMQKNATTYECFCGKLYKSRSSLWYHKKKCIQTDSLTIVEEKVREPPNDNSIILGLISQNKELMEMLQEQNKIIQDIVPKIGNNNTTTNNNNTNQFNLQVFLNEDCKDALNFSEFIEQIQVSFEDLENQVESGYIKGISKLFIESLQELGTNKRPIHCTDKKRKTLYIKENDEWDKEGSQDTLKKGIQEVTRKTMITLMKEKENRPEEYSDMDSEFSEKCLYIQRNLIPTAPRETAFDKVMENITKNSGIIE